MRFQAEILRAVSRALTAGEAFAPANVSPWLSVAAVLVDGAAAILEGNGDGDRERAAMDAAEALAAAVERAKFGGGK